MKIVESLAAIENIPAALQKASDEIRLTREQLQTELKNTRVLAEKAFLAIMRQLSEISRELKGDSE